MNCLPHFVLIVFSLALLNSHCILILSLNKILCMQLTTLIVFWGRIYFSFDLHKDGIFFVSHKYYSNLDLVNVLSSCRSIPVMVSTVITSPRIRLINQRYGLKPGLAGKSSSWSSDDIISWNFVTFKLSYCFCTFFYRFTEFGGAVPYRPAEDLAFSVARFIQKGGSFINYYMVKWLLKQN